MGKPRLTISLTAASLAGLLILADTAAAVTYRTVALTGEQAPGAEPDVVFSSFGAGPVLNGAGQTALVASLIGAGVDGTNSRGIFSEGRGTLTLIARDGQQAPDAGSDVVFNLANSSPVLNGAGQTAFSASLAGAGVDATNDGGIYSEGGGALAQVAREGQQAPGTDPGVVFGGFSNPMLNGAGQTAFHANLTGTGVVATNDSGIYREGSGTLAQVAREGQQAPDAEPGVVFSSFLQSSPVLNGAGQTAFFGFLTGASVDGTNDTGIYSKGGGTLAQVAREGQQAPVVEPGVVFGGFSKPGFNDAGQTAFSAGLTGAGVDGTNNSGIYRSDGGTLTQLVRAGQQVPDADPGVLFGGFDSPVLNAAGQTAFLASIIGTNGAGINGVGIFSDGGGTLAQVARRGQQAPGAEPGVVFGNFFVPPALNGAGQIAFFASLTELGTNNRFSIWATDPAGLLTLIARSGDLFDVNDDPLIEDLRTISFVSLIGGSGGEDGRPSSFNDAGQLAFQLSFTDGTSGVFVANTRLPGDLDGDGFVGITDLNLVLGNWNQSVTPWDFASGDPSGDGFVGIEDLNAVLGNWNAGTPPGASPADDAHIPEPSGFGVLLACSGCLLRRGWTYGHGR